MWSLFFYINVTVIFVYVKIIIVYQTVLILSFLDYLLVQCLVSNFWGLFLQFNHQLDTISLYKFHLKNEKHFYKILTLNIKINIIKYNYTCMQFNSC